MDPIAEAVSIVTLGTYSDINTILVPSSSDVSALLATILVLLKLIMPTLAAYAIADRLAGKQVAIIAAAATLIAVAVFTQPWAQMADVSSRISMLQTGLADDSPIEYTPTLLRDGPVNVALNYTELALDKFAGSAALLKNATTISFGVPFSNEKVRIDWLYYALIVALAAVGFFVVKQYNKYLAIAVIAVAVYLLLGIPAELTARIVLLIAMVAAAYLLQKVHPVLVLYPAVAAALLLISMLTLPTNVVLVVLLVLMFLSLVPLFYFVGIVIAGVGKVVEEREKLGMKVRPKKMIEETAGQWDPVAVAIVLTSIFVAALALFGATIYGIGTFVGMAVGLIRS